MILNARRNTSPRLAAKWLTFLASAAALFAVAAICLAPRIVLAQSESAPPAVNTQGSVIDEPIRATPSVASVAASLSPEAGEAPSGDAALPVTPRPSGLGSGPKSKTGPSSAVNSQPAVLPVPTTSAAPVAPVALIAPPAPRIPEESFRLSAAPAPEPRLGRTPRPARAEPADSALEERLERLEKMVESLMARGYGTPNPPHLKPSPDAIAPMERREIEKNEAYGRRQADMARKHELEAREIERNKEHAKREAARAADLAKRAAADAERIAKAEEKRPTRRNLKEGSQKQLDELRKQLEILDRQREKLEFQIEQLERTQDEVDEQGEQESNSDAQSDTAESGSDATQPLRR
jgi:hypothetical protein